MAEAEQITLPAYVSLDERHRTAVAIEYIDCEIATIPKKMMPAGVCKQYRASTPWRLRLSTRVRGLCVGVQATESFNKIEKLKRKTAAHLSPKDGFRAVRCNKKD